MGDFIRKVTVKIEMKLKGQFVKKCLPRIDLIKTVKWNYSHGCRTTKNRTLILNFIMKVTNTNSFKITALICF